MTTKHGYMKAGNEIHSEQNIINYQGHRTTFPLPNPYRLTLNVEPPCLPGVSAHLGLGHPDEYGISLLAVGFQSGTMFMWPMAVNPTSRIAFSEIIDVCAPVSNNALKV